MIFPNKKYNSSKEYFSDYLHSLSTVIKPEHLNILYKITIFLKKKIKNKKQIFVCGNGGAASVANHFLCDFNKGIKISSKKKLVPRVISLTNSMELITAISNDIKFEDIFSFQLENLANSKDVLILFSCSGKSKNIINAAKYSKKNNLDLISFVGFGKNNFIHKMSKFSLTLNINNYGIAEDTFQIIMHMISQFIRFKNLKSYKEEIL